MAPGTNKRARQSPEPYNNSLNPSNTHHQHQALYPAPSPSSSSSSRTPTTTNTTSALSLSSASSSKDNNNNNNGSSSSSSFRNVSACNRCRLRKNRCDQNLPACAACQRASAKCVGFDPITHREIPRTYVYFLESRVAYLEGELSRHHIPFLAPSKDFDLGATPVVDAASSSGLSPASEDLGGPRDGSGGGGGHHAAPTAAAAAAKRHARAISSNSAGTIAGSEASGVSTKTAWEQKVETDKLNNLVSNIGMVSVQGASDLRYLGTTSGISFARVVYAAVKSSVSEKNGRKGSMGGPMGMGKGTTNLGSGGGPTSMRDSFFGLQTKPQFKPAPFPDRELGLKLVGLYFEHPNPQMPILHRGEFMEMFDRAYAKTGREGHHKRRTARELYMLNIVFAIGAGTILLDPKSAAAAAAAKEEDHGVIKREGGPVSPSLKRPKLSSGSSQRPPEEYHSSAMMHLESFLGTMPTPTSPERLEVLGGSLEQLQAILLLAAFALMRPVAPGLWYIAGVAMRLALDLGLHYEDGDGGDHGVSSPVEDVNNAGREGISATGHGPSAADRGHREWVRDLRRRLWWCVYSFDRLVSTCVGRPFGVTDQAITTEWPSILDDKDITPSGFLISPFNYHGPSYKRVTHHYLRLRLLQSEILQVLQYRQAQKVHDQHRRGSNAYMHTRLSSPFLQPFKDCFPAWRADIDHRLWEWKESAPLQKDTAVAFNIKFLELNYWQAVIMLYRQSLGTPPSLACERGLRGDVGSPMSPTHMEDHEDEDEIFLKVAEAGQRVLKLYKELHRVGLVNYTYLATVHLFTAGIAFLYSIWHSPMVRARMTLEHVQYTVRAGTSVLGDLVATCPPAEACRDAFGRMAKATIKMCQNTGGFGSQVQFTSDPPSSADPFGSQGGGFDGGKIPPASNNSGPSIRMPGGSGGEEGSSFATTATTRPPPQFDYNLKDLFPEANLNMNATLRRFGSQSETTTSPPSQQQQPYPYPSPAPTNTSLASSTPTLSNLSSSLTSNTHSTTAFTQQQQQQPTPQPPSAYGHSANATAQPSYQQQQQQQQQHYDPRLLQDPSSTSASTSMHQQQQSHSQPYDPMYDLVSSSTNANNHNAQNHNHNHTLNLQDLDLDFLLAHHDSMPPTYNGGDAGTTGLHLGFDGRADHYWSSGSSAPGVGGMGGGVGDYSGDGGDGGAVGQIGAGGAAGAREEAVMPDLFGGFFFGGLNSTDYYDVGGGGGVEQQQQQQQQQHNNWGGGGHDNNNHDIHEAGHPSGHDGHNGYEQGHGQSSGAGGGGGGGGGGGPQMMMRMMTAPSSLMTTTTNTTGTGTGTTDMEREGTAGSTGVGMGMGMAAGMDLLMDD